MPEFKDRAERRELGGDDFWTLRAPERQAAAPVPPRDTPPVPVEDGTPRAEDAGGRIPPRPAGPERVMQRPSGFIRQRYENRGRRKTPKTAGLPQPELLLEYAPAQSLISQVRVYRWPNSYHFYEKFMRNAHLSHAATGRECERVSYFSYIPQYTQLSRAQAHFYFWFRDNARAGRYLDADLSYILLYMYEIINLPDLIGAEEGCRLLCGLYLAYRETYRELDRYLPDWLCDYCLIFRLPPPAALQPILYDVIAHASLKEFYLTGATDGSLTGFTAALLAGASEYDYRASRWYASCREDFDRHIPGAVCHALETMRARNEGLFAPEAVRTVTVSRDAFCGSLCEHNIKRRIDVTLVAISRSHVWRGQVTAMVKYAENQLRAVRHLKSRLSATGLSPEAREALDGYFAPLLPRGGKPAPAVPDYEAYYDTPETPFTAEVARAIEADSWHLTELLAEETPAAAARALAREAEDAPAESAEEVPGALVWEPGTVPGGEGKTVSGGEAMFEDGRAGQAVGSGDGLDDDTRDVAEDTVSSAAGFAVGTVAIGTAAGAAAAGRKTEAVSPVAGTPAGDWLPEALSLLLSGGSFESFCTGRGLFPDEAASRINEAAYDRLGDVVLEQAGVWRLIPDYREDVEAWSNM